MPHSEFGVVATHGAVTTQYYVIMRGKSIPPMVMASLSPASMVPPPTVLADLVRESYAAGQTNINVSEGTATYNSQNSSIETIVQQIIPFA